MVKVTLKSGAGKHRLPGGKVCRPGEEFEVSEAQLAAFKDKLDVVLSAEQLKAIAEKKADEEAMRAKEEALAKAKAAEEAALAAKAAGERAAKTGTAGKG